MKIATKDSQGRENGWLLPVWNAREQEELRPEQVYVTTLKPGMRKGPHLHMKRRGFFTCVAGSAWILYRDPKTGWYDKRFLMPGTQLVIPPGTPAAIYNTGSEDTILLNLPSPSWAPDDQDEWVVENWVDPEWWKENA